MIYAAWIAAVLMLTWVFNHTLDRQHNPNARLGADSSAPLKEVVLRRNRMGHYIAPGRINGRAVEFLLDTGATDVSVPQALANKLNLTPGPAMSTQTANGVITTYATVLDSVSLGNIELSGVRASINPSSASNGVLLGMAFLKHLELVQRGDTLTIRQ